jgi:mannose-1-phosphate guanylyltransferase/mannose-6-phosphate isomerase
MDNVVVVETGDAVLVAPMARAQEVRELVERLKRDKRREASEHRRALRPWGHYEGKDAGERYQVKRITVKPGGRLSLQKHYHRSEHWVVVRGTAKVTIEDKVEIVHENQSTYIPVGAVHRLENPGLIPLELIEVQVGSYLEEDDIIRVSDDYGR